MAEESEAEAQADDICPECGAATEDKDFCPGCGAPLTTVICPSCYEENLARADFCSSCNRPLEYTAFIDPMHFIWSLGWVLREISHKADDRRINRLLLYGAVLAFGPSLLLILLLLLSSVLRVSMRGMDVVSDILLILSLIGPICYSILLFKVLAARRRQANEPKTPAAETPPLEETPAADVKAS